MSSLVKRQYGVFLFTESLSVARTLASGYEGGGSSPGFFLLCFFFLSFFSSLISVSLRVGFNHHGMSLKNMNTQTKT